MTEKSTGNQPEKKFSTGAISATVWKNAGTSKKTGESVEFRTVSLQRRYTDKDGKWQTSGSLRISDLLRIKVSDLFDSDMIPRARFTLKEKKTGKTNTLTITNGTRTLLEDYVRLTRIKYNNDYIFRSRQGGNRPITRVQAHNILKNAVKDAGIKGINISTHSLRKSWGYHAYTRFNLSLDDIMLKLNHQSLRATKHYIGLSADEKAQIEETVSF